MNQTTLWMAQDRARELRQHAVEAHRGRRGRPVSVRSLLRSLRNER